MSLLPRKTRRSTPCYFCIEMFCRLNRLPRIHALRAKRAQHLPMVLSKTEVNQVKKVCG